MYKSDIHKAMSAVSLASGGLVDTLVGAFETASGKMFGALVALSKNTDEGNREASTRISEVHREVLSVLSEISPSRIAIDLNNLNVVFDSELRKHPSLEVLLRPGRDAVAELTGAYDVALQKNKNPPSIVGIFSPALRFATCCRHYRAIASSLEDESTNTDSSIATVSIEVDGISQLGKFTMFMALLYHLAASAEKISRYSDSPDEAADNPSTEIESIESGSPIKISLKGTFKSIQMLLTMIKDVVRVPYLHFTSQGRAIHSMEIFARAKELGIDSPDVLRNLENAMRRATKTYSESIKDDAVKITIEGEVVTQGQTHALGQDELRAIIPEESPRKLQGPES